MRQTIKKPYVITLCSGKGGVGKSVLAANLAYAMSMESLKTLIWDADLFFPNQHLLFGVEPPVRLTEVYSKRVSVMTALFQFNDNLYLLADLPAASFRSNIESNIYKVVYDFLSEESDFDVIIIDTPAAGSTELLQCCAMADLINIVITDEPTSLLDAYGLIKILMQYFETDTMNLLVNNVIDWEDADEISIKLNLATEKFLNTQLDVLGFVPYDRAVRQSILAQELFMINNIESDVTKSINKIAKSLKNKISNE